MIVYFRVFFAFLFLFQSSCAINPVTRNFEYSPTEHAYKNGDTASALEVFPKTEMNGFITEIEKSWLEFWEGQQKPNRLEKLKESIDSRQYTSISREFGYFLWQETHDGYVPSEHEIVILHFLRAQNFIQAGKSEEARIELRRAQRILEQQWDDKALRIWLGSLWASLGEWEDAQVDFRVAGISPSENKKPTRLFVHFFGVAPTAEWKNGDYSPTFSEDHQDLTDIPWSASTLPWFERHLLRNTAIRKLALQSNHKTQFLSSEVSTGVEKSYSHAAKWGIRAIGIALGSLFIAAIVGIAIHNPGFGSGAGEGLGIVAMGGIGIISGTWKLGERVQRQLNKTVREDYKKKQEDLKIYRFVRFMPTWIGISLDRGPTNIRDKIVKLRGSKNTEVIFVNHFRGNLDFSSRSLQ